MKSHGGRYFGVGSGLSHTQTKSSKGSTPPGGASSMARGERKDPPSGAAQFPGKGLSGTQTKNSLTNKR